MLASAYESGLGEIVLVCAILFLFLSVAADRFDNLHACQQVRLTTSQVLCYAASL